MKVAPQTVCDDSRTLDEWCELNVCPRQLTLARPSLCENELKTSLTAEELAPNHKRAANSCGGESVMHIGKVVRTRYDYDAMGALIGVTVLDAVASEDCAGVSHTYGKSCDVTGMTERLCAVLCPAIACRHRAVTERALRRNSALQ